MMQKSYTKHCLRLSALALVLSLILPLSVSAAPASGMDYLVARYPDLESRDTWNGDDFITDLAVVSGIEEGYEKDAERFNLADAIRNAILAADYEELALSYPESKIQERLEIYELTSSGDTTIDRYVVAGLDAQLYDVTVAQNALEGADGTDDQLVDLLYNVAEAQGNTRQFLGYSDDPIIDARLQQVWDTFAIFQDEVLNDLGTQAVESELVTGFNLKRGAFDAHFDSAYTLQYGHSSLAHAHQLMVLLKSEGLRAKVQLEPKVSIYEYLLDWGPIGEPTLTYAVEQAGDDLYLAHAVEYDLLLEFDSKDEMLEFDRVVQDYAKKWEGNEDAVGLIRDSWWQPLYTLLRDDLPEDEYFKIHDLIVRNPDHGDYRFHSFVLDKNYEATVAALQELAPDLEVESQVRYCNLAFYNYLTGEDFQ